MNILKTTATLGLGLLLAAPVYAYQTTTGTNEQNRQQTKAELKQQEKADKAQAKADKSARKAEGSHKAKKAAMDQDKANNAAAQPQ